MRVAHIVAVITVAFMWGCGVNWFPDDTTKGGGFTNNSTLTNTSTASQHNFSTILGNLSTASQAVKDSTGTITVKSVVAKETSKTASDVEFTLWVDVINSGSTAARVEMELAGLDRSGNAIFKTTETCLVDAKTTKIPGYTGQTVTLEEWNKIARWRVLKVVKK